MKSITQMREEIAEVMKKLGDSKAQVEAETREPTVDEKREAHDMLDRVDELKENIELEERLQGTAAGLAAPVAEPTRPEVRQTTVTEREQEKRDSFGSLGEQLVAVMRAEDPTSRSVDPRLRTNRAVSGMSENVQSGGGFLIQPDFSDVMLKNTFETGKLASRVGKISLSGNTNSIKINGIDESSRVLFGVAIPG